MSSDEEYADAVEVAPLKFPDRKKPMCITPGCPKQSQGRRNNDMCRKCFLEQGGIIALPKSRKASSKKPSNRAKCAIPGCPKESQGAANGYMCRAHFIESQKVQAVSGAAAAAAAASMNDGIGEEEEAVAAAVAAVTATAQDGPPGESGKKARQACVVPGCEKQSQGRRNAYMCRAHFVETHPAVPSPVRRKGGHPSAREVLPGAATAAAVVAAAGTEAASALLDAAGVITQEKGKTPSDASKSTKNACAVPGCTKQSQGARNGYMCRKCYRLSVAPPHMPAPARRARKSAGGVPGSAKAASAAKSNRPACSIPGCPKQSQGRASNYMCRKCFMQYQKGGGIAMPEVETAAAAAAAAVAAQMPTDPELAEMVRKEVQRIKRLQQGDEDCDAGSAPKRSRQEASSTAAVSAIVAQRKQAHERAAQLGTELRAARAAELSLEQALQGMASCVKCQVEPKTVSLAPCGHLVYCDSCSSGENECPICLSSIEEARHVAV